MTLNALPTLDICSQREGEGGRNFRKCGLCGCVVGIQVYLPATWLLSMRGKLRRGKLTSRNSSSSTSALGSVCSRKPSTSGPWMTSNPSDISLFFEARLTPSPFTALMWKRTVSTRV